MTNKENREPGAIVGREETTSASSGMFYQFYDSGSSMAVTRAAKDNLQWLTTSFALYG